MKECNLARRGWFEDHLATGMVLLKLSYDCSTVHSPLFFRGIFETRTLRLNYRHLCKRERNLGRVFKLPRGAKSGNIEEREK